MFDCTLMVERQGRQIGSLDELLTKQISVIMNHFISNSNYLIGYFLMEKGHVCNFSQNRVP